ncbi:MFS transporter [Rhizobium mongolense]|uniref:MFS transporter n=1 Tax=Rhizobium mongolense TaxID=57676 RepID=UPI000B88A72E|nr:MFS transporter [Rhizobium mongolense]
MPIALYALAATAFCIGTTEFVIMGLLLEVGRDFGVSISAAGLLITGYALGVVVGAPLLTLATSSFPRKPVLLGLTALFILGNLLCALAADYWTLMIARVVTAFAHGAFFGVGAVVATGLVPKERQATAIAVMFTGATLANILGVPFGTYIGQAFGWRATFWAVTGIAAVAFLATAFLVPAIDAGSKRGWAAEFGAFKRKQVWLGLLMTVLGYGGVFTAFTYIAPILNEVTGFDESTVAPVLILFGAGLILGNIIGGRFADCSLMPAVTGSLAFLALVLAFLSLAQFHSATAIAAVFMLGAAAFGTVSPLQMRVLQQAEGAPSLASAANIAAFNVGNAGGAALGGVVIDSALGLQALGWIAAIVTLSGLGVALWSWTLDRSLSPRPILSGAETQVAPEPVGDQH